ncbi:MAG: hypothetical protein V4612_03465 [Pseudomonadota bacterium]
MPEQPIKKSKKYYYLAVFWLTIIGLVYFSGKYLINEFHYKQAKDNAQSQFANIETEIYQTPIAHSEANKIEEKPLNQNEILLKQQLQISELQNSFSALQLDLARLKTNDSLPKIILSFVKLQDLIAAGQNFDNELQKLEVLCRADFALTDKIIKLKLTLKNQPKNRQELAKEFANLIPQIKAKQVEIKSGGTWWGRIKAVIARFIIIKKTGESNSASEVESAMFKIINAIENNRLDVALQNVDLIGNDYREILAGFRNNLQSSSNFQQISNEIYKYLEMLSND